MRFLLLIAIASVALAQPQQRGTVTSISLVGTANQITVTGSSPLTSQGSWTLSVPSGFLLPGTINKLTLTPPATGATITIADGKVFTVSGTLTLAGTDGSTLNVGAGGLLGSNAFTSTGYLPLAGGAMTGTAFASLGTPANGSFVYCSDCDAGILGGTCTSAGAKTGNFAMRLNGAWRCID